MRILQRYILLEFLTNLASAVAVFTGLMFLMSLLEPLRRGFTLGQTLRFLHLYIPYVLTWSIPMSVLTAAVTTFAKLAESGELTAVQTSGVHVWQLMKPAVMAVAAICLFCYHANASWIPQTRHRLKQKTEQMAVDLFLARLRSGRRDFSFPPYDIDIKQVGEGNRLISVNIRASLNEEETKVLVIRAREAVLEAESDGHSSGLKLTMFDGATTLVEPPLSGMPGAPNAPESLPPREWSWEKDVMVIGGQSTEDMPFDEDEQTLASLLSKLRASNTGILDRPKAEPSRTQLIEAHKRLSLSIVSLVFVLLGSPLGMLCRKSNRLLGFASGLILSLGLYYPLLLFGIFLAKRSIVNPWLGLWLPNALFIIAGLWLSRSVLRA